MKAKRPCMIVMLFIMSSWCFSETDAEASERWYQQGLDALKQGELQKAERHFKWALRYNPEHAHARKGLVMMEKRRPEIEAEKNKLNGHSIRFSYATVPGLDNGPTDDYGGYVTEADGSWQWEITYVKHNFKTEESRLGWLIGGGWFIAFNAGEDEYEEDYDGIGLGMIFQAGGAARVGEHLMFELSPYVGIGTNGLGGYGMYGIKAGAHVLLGHLGLGVEAGYHSFDAEVASGSGPKIAAVVSLNF